MSHAIDTPLPGERSGETARTRSFDDLVALHFDLIQHDVPPTSAPVFVEALAEFERAHGPIQQAWWSRTTPSGTALTIPRTSALKSVVAAQTWPALHRITDDETRAFPNVAAALHEADGLAIRAGEILRGTAQRVALTHVFGAVVSLLGITAQANRLVSDELVVEPESPIARNVQSAIDDFRSNLRIAEAYYRRAAARTTQIFYFWGMAVGVVVIAVLTSVIAFLVSLLLDASGLSPEPEKFALLLTAISAGAVGACVSAMWRISSGDFYADFEAGSTHARIIGSFRPFIGGIFGLGLYFALQAGFLPTLEEQASDFYLAAFLAFLGGFSERLAPDIFAKAEKRISGSGHEEPR